MDDSSIAPWVVPLTGLFVAIMIASYPLGKALWDDRLRSLTYDRPPTWWVWGDATWHGHIRAFPFGLGGGVMYLVLGLALVSAPPAIAGSVVYKPALLALWLGYPALYIAILLFNRPRMFVAPPLRGKPGLIRELIESHRERRSRFGCSEDD